MFEWCDSRSEQPLPVDKNFIWKLEATRWEQHTERARLPLIARHRERLMRSSLPHLLELALSLARADLSSDDPSCDLPKAV